ncbi:MAG: hypothetical protein HFG27_05275 [Provencibacterium sp.]|jgi:dienelactone hydrolase|nr:hypothetical protein [Provencibacterium sp.]
MSMPFEHNRSLLAAIPPALRYDGAKDFAGWQSRCTKKLEELLGLPLARCEEDRYTVEYTREEADYSETRFHFQSEPGYEVPAHLLVPKGAKGPLPVVICLQGHSTGMHISLGRPKFPNDEKTISGGDRNFAVRAVREGYCAIALEQRCFGECGGTPEGPDCTNSSLTALLIGRTTIGERVWDVMRLIDVIERHIPQADSKRILCMGNSGGGTAAFYSACMEPRIRFCMPSCAVCTYGDSIAAMRHCACNYIPGIRKYFDMGDLAGLIAPRPLVIVAGREDPIFPLSGVRESFAEAQRLYAAAGNPQGCTLVIGEGGHRFYADDAWPVMHRYLDAAN